MWIQNLGCMITYIPYINRTLTLAEGNTNIKQEKGSQDGIFSAFLLLLLCMFLCTYEAERGGRERSLLSGSYFSDIFTACTMMPVDVTLNFDYVEK